jgi:hypothetical protein
MAFVKEVLDGIKSKKLGFAADIFEQDIEGIIRKIRLGDIQPSAEQPRTRFDDSINALPTRSKPRACCSRLS